MDERVNEGVGKPFLNDKQQLPIDQVDGYDEVSKGITDYCRDV